MSLRRLAPIIGALWVGGCGILSGLDSLQIEEAGPDSSTLDVSTEPEVIPETGLDCALDAHDPYCFGSKCDGGETCCITRDAATCMPLTGCTTSIALDCTDPAQCNLDAGYRCCIEGITLSTTSCPLVASGPANLVNSACAKCSASFTGATARVCAADDDCDPGTTCQAIELATNASIKLGICM